VGEPVAHTSQELAIAKRLVRSVANGDHRTSFASETTATRRNKHDRTWRPAALTVRLEVRVLPGPLFLECASQKLGYILPACGLRGCDHSLEIEIPDDRE
jgi:hypothetical protein